MAYPVEHTHYHARGPEFEAQATRWDAYRGGSIMSSYIMLGYLSFSVSPMSSLALYLKQWWGNFFLLRVIWIYSGYV